MTSFTLGINTGFATNRFPEPEEWARIVAEELELTSVQLVADLLNPFWPESVIEAEVEVVEKVPERNRVRLRTTCRNQDDTVVLEGEAVVIPRRE